MRRVVAILTIASILSEVPSCSKSDDIGHGGVEKPSATAKPSINPNNPHRTKDDKKYTVSYFAEWHPHRPVQITWKLDGSVKQENFFQSHFRHDWPGASSGSTATLFVKNLRQSGFLICKIYVDGRLLVPKEGDTWDPWMRRNDTGNCQASVVIP